MNDAKYGHSTSEKQTLVEEGTLFKGTLSSNCPIVIKGQFEGDISGPSLHVSTTGSVSGTVKVGEIRSEGELAGQYEADVVRLAGRVKDCTVIKAKSLEIKLQPDRGRMEVTFGECDLEVGDEPTKEQSVAKPTGHDAIIASAPLLGLSEAADSPVQSDGRAAKSSKESQPTTR